MCDSMNEPKYYAANIQRVNISASINKNAVFGSGRPYFRFVDFPVNIKEPIEMTDKPITVNQTFEISIGTQKVQLTLREVQELQDELNRILGKNIPTYPIFPEMHKTHPENPVWPKRPLQYEVWCNTISPIDRSTKSEKINRNYEIG